MTAPAQDHLTGQNHSPTGATDAYPRRLSGASTFVLYLAIALIYFARGLPGDSGNWYIGRETDPGQTMWFFNWWRFSLTHGLNPFITDLVWAPTGNQPGVDDLCPTPRVVLDPSTSNGRRARNLQRHGAADAGAGGIHRISLMPACDARVLAIGAGRIHLRFFSPHAWRSTGTPGRDRGFPGATDRADRAQASRQRNLDGHVLPRFWRCCWSPNFCVRWISSRR